MCSAVSGNGCTSLQLEKHSGVSCQWVHGTVCEFRPGKLLGITLKESSSRVRRCFGPRGQVRDIDEGGRAWWTVTFLGISPSSHKCSPLCPLAEEGIGGADTRPSPQTSLGAGWRRIPGAGGVLPLSHPFTGSVTLSSDALPSPRCRVMVLAHLSALHPLFVHHTYSASSFLASCKWGIPGCENPFLP